MTHTNQNYEKIGTIAVPVREKGKQHTLYPDPYTWNRDPIPKDHPDRSNSRERMISFVGFKIQLNNEEDDEEGNIRIGREIV